MNRLVLEIRRRSREKKHRLFMELLRRRANTRIVNVGAAGGNLGLREQFECWYPHRERITEGGPNFEEVADYRTSFSGVTAVAFHSCVLPFADRSFDIVCSNAVLEHLPGMDLVAALPARCSGSAAAGLQLLRISGIPQSRTITFRCYNSSCYRSTAKAVTRLGKESVSDEQHCDLQNEVYPEVIAYSAP